MTKAEIKAVITADATQYTSELNRVAKKADTLSKELKKSGKEVGGLGEGLKKSFLPSIQSAVEGAGGLGRALSTMLGGLSKMNVVLAGVSAVAGVFNTLKEQSQSFGDAVNRIFSQIGASVSFILNPRNWGTGFVDGLKEAWAVAGQLADASDKVGTYTMEWVGNQQRLNNQLAKADEIMSAQNRTIEEERKAIAAAQSARQEYVNFSQKFIAAKKEEATAIAKEVANIAGVKLSMEELNDLLSEGVYNTDALAAKGGKFAKIADAMSDSMQQGILSINNEIETTERGVAAFGKRVEEITKRGGKIKIDVDYPKGSVADIERQISELQKKQKLTIPFSFDYAQIDRQIQVLRDQLNGVMRDEQLELKMPVFFDISSIDAGLVGVEKKFENIDKQVDNMAGASAVFGALGKQIAAMGSESREATIAMQSLAIAEQIAAMAAAIHTASEGDPYTLAARIIAAGAAVTAAIVSIQALSKQSFAEGGIVAAQFETGDRAMVRANAGEMIITKAQQGSLFRMLKGGGMPPHGGEVTFKIAGTDLVGVLDQTTRLSQRSL